MDEKRLVTIKKAHQETGASTSFFKQLVREQKLTGYYINSALYISLVEFEAVAKPRHEVKAQSQAIKDMEADGEYSKLIMKKK